MEYEYYLDNIALFGMMGSGKTHATKILISKIKPENVLVLDSHDEYVEYPRRIQAHRPYDFTQVNDLIETAYSYGKNAKKVVIFDDIDLYIKHDRESYALGDFFIDARHYNLGTIILSKRPVNLDKRIYQASKYIFLFKGVLFTDLQNVARECGLYDDRLISIWERVNSADLEKEHPFIFVDNSKKRISFRSGIE